MKKSEELIDPRQYLRSAPPASPIWILTDALEAATNGMANPDAASRLSDIDEDAFIPWKALVRAIDALYAEDDAAVEVSLERIPDASPPGALKPLFRFWLDYPGEESEKDLEDGSAAVAGLHRRVFSDDHPIGSLAEQAEEALRHGMTDHFEALAGRILRELRENPRSDGPRLALRYAALCLKAMDDTGVSDSDFFSLLIKVLGRQDGLLAMAFALVGHDDMTAASTMRNALGSDGDHAFADPISREVIRAAADILSQAEHAEAPAHGNGSRIRRKSRGGDGAGQLDLFGGIAG